jgi:hypothetical protein
LDFNGKRALLLPASHFDSKNYPEQMWVESAVEQSENIAVTRRGSFDCLE